MITRAPRRTVRMLYGLRGLGDCAPTDVACVQAEVAASVANQQRTGEVEASADYNTCIADGTDPGTCAARWPSGYSGEVPFTNLSPQQQQAQMASPVQAAFNYLSVPNVAGELKQFGINPQTLIPTDTPQQTYTPVILPAAPAPPAPAVTAPPPAPPPPAASPKVTPITSTVPATNPQGQTIISSSGVTQPTVTLPTVAGFDLSSIPWWGWAGGAALLLFMLKGGKG